MSIYIECDKEKKNQNGGAEDVINLGVIQKSQKTVSKLYTQRCDGMICRGCQFKSITIKKNQNGGADDVMIFGSSKSHGKLGRWSLSMYGILQVRVSRSATKKMSHVSKWCHIGLDISTKLTSSLMPWTIVAFALVYHHHWLYSTILCTIFYHLILIAGKVNLEDRN